ncbi:MAG TPA: metalloregulator ArsR/SmtB family transcription factor [Vicinamibacterales bacterium]|nr:metalloregulator ArsR/SmtB family transcription factor [Vicinamibacterales bacterium]
MKGGARRWKRSAVTSKPRRSATAAARQAAPVFAALGDQTRLYIVASLSARGPMSIVALTTGSGVTRQAVSKHLQVLLNAGLVRLQRAGRETRWELDREPLDAARDSLEQIATQWDQALERLKAFVESS